MVLAVLGHLPRSGRPALGSGFVFLQRCIARCAQVGRLLVPQASARQAAALLACLPVSEHCCDAGFHSIQPLLPALRCLLRLVRLQQHSAGICQTPGLLH